ncbi:class I adenylate-forming enzyme family protein [Actinomycetospora soli]|uniref:class I adenylate-forming enzyme family protein n=1 Tax=Actinomycetospora soli TaxID=2893887 RepID=UPI001E3D324D|nr:AMP-binding protein [Actinomycetospora soli]MCD2190525.1 AMP-binding protein [Actinomycetospora soli]
MTESLDERRDALRRRFPVWTPMTLHERLAQLAGEFGERPFVITDDRTVTYAETDAWSRRLADGLAALGVRPGDRVGIVMANYLEFVPLKFAVARAGAVAVPFNYLYRTDELRYVLEQSACQVLVTMTGFMGLDQLGMLDEIAPGWDRGEQTALPELREVVVLSTDGRTRDGVRSVADLESLGTAHAGAADGRGAEPGDVADILYTSGTTGSPKGVLITHDASQRTGYASALTRAFGDGRRILFSLPCYHMFGYVEGLMAAMMVGGAIVPQTAFDPGRYLEGIERHRATDILCVPTMTVALLEHPDLATRDLSSLRAILSGAAPAPVWLWEKVRDGLGVDEIVTGYGMTEQGGAMTLSLPEDPLEVMATTVGRVKMAGVAGIPERDGDLTEFRTIDVFDGEPLPDGQEGELTARGPTNMLGFWGKPEETVLALSDDGWVRSGDLGIVRADRYLVLTGRSKELYKSGGELVMPKEVEEVLSRHPGVSQAYAVGVADDRWGEIGVACIVRKPGAEVEAEELIALCKEQLARFKVPRRVVFLTAEELPSTPTGKIQKFRLARMVAERAPVAG